MGIINFYKIWWYMALHMLEACKGACKGNLSNNDIMTCDLCLTFEDILWESSTFTKSDDTWLFMLEACKVNLLNKWMSRHVVCVGHLRNFVRGKYGQQILCHIFEDHTRNYFATRETHEFNISHKTGNRNPTVMGFGKLAPPMHHPLEVEFSRSKLPLSQFVNPQLYMGTSISYPIYRIYIPIVHRFCRPCLQRQGYCV
jgi:hypothetical protein